MIGIATGQAPICLEMAGQGKTLNKGIKMLQNSLHYLLFVYHLC
jgi:hypothetical protein